MTKLLAVNTLLEYSKEKVERILWINNEYTIAFIIDIFANTCIPFVRNIEDIHEGLKEGNIIILDDDPVFKLISEEDLSDEYKKIRNKRWNIISSINTEPQIFETKKRKEIILKASEQFDISSKSINRYLIRYWQRSKNINALLPDFCNCGNPGKERNNNGLSKIGRPKKYKDIIGVGINIDDEIKRIFRIAIDKYYYTSKQNSFTVAYELMLKEFFFDDFKIQKGIKIPLIKSNSELPTINQFKYWYKQERNIKKEVTLRKSAKKYELESRAVIGSSTEEAQGPGSVFMVDATIGDVFLTSMFNRNWIIGRPIIYCVMDLFSTKIVGIYIGLEGPSWSGAMTALANCARDKVEFCREYGISINNEEWNCDQLCDSLLADRGEFEGYAVENLINGLHINVKNTSSYRGDLKAKIERFFLSMTMAIKPFVPGYINEDHRQRTGKDYRIEGRLNLFEFTQIVIKLVLYHNSHWLKSYNREEMMIEDDVDCIPNKLWEWGVRNRAGKLRSVSEDTIKLYLMPSAIAQITFRGIKFKGIYYSCNLALVEKWFEKARQCSWSITVSYDIRNMSYIYIKNKDINTFEKCFLLDNQQKYKNKSLDEIQHLFKMEQEKETLNQESILQSKIDLISEIQAIVKKSEKANNNVVSSMESDRSKIKGIRINRKIEKTLNRNNEAFELGKKTYMGNSEVVSMECAKAGKADGNFSSIELLRKKQKEKLNGVRK
ncbi:Mu transposase C-terminal domain-containing protein [Clostridium estertheticum]|uniref:Mu transposase C-terminal domain-containing protein n=1 Tax=Clostridium estertheticum TaxID=238834 RepID=UPI001CD137E0|nr:Mu transposase C-terminal domain-containing protein [Clostridium estertheticum]MBZ9689341.1 Mu transposase C-terminal domain-containing protein [Clostridium estertheticum]